MKQVMMIKFDSLKWRMIDEYKVANPFIEVGFRQVKDVVDLRVFDLLNISRINNNRAEERLKQKPLCERQWKTTRKRNS